MAELSRFWNGTALGDAAVEAPYDAPTEFAGVMMAMTAAQAVTDKGGIWIDDLNDFSISTAGANNQTVASGRGQVYGNWYSNDAPISFTIATPGASTRVDRLVLRKDWAAQTVRMVKIAGVEGAGAPALVQSAGTTWDVPLYQVSITTGGVMTVTDQRVVLQGLAGAGVTVAPAGGLITYAVANSTSNVGFTVSNTTDAGASHAYIESKVGGVTSTGDPQFRWTIPGGTSWYAGVDNSASDAFIIGTGTAVGTTGFLQIATGGTVLIGVGPSDAANSLTVRSDSGNGITTGTTQRGASIIAKTTSGATTAGIGIYTSVHTEAASFTQTNAYGLYVDNASKGAGSTIGTASGVTIASQTAGGTSNFGLFVNAPSGGSAHNVGIFVDGSIRITTNQTANQFFTASSGAATTTMYIGNASINVTSDVRLKRAIADTKTDWLEVLSRVRVRDFGWNDPSDTNTFGKNARGRYTGLIAQEVIVDAPELRYTINAPDIRCKACRQGAVCITHDSYWGLDLQHFTGPIIDALQRLQRENAALKERITVLGG